MVIEVPFPGNRIRQSRVRMIGHPYFFNVQNLTPLRISWKLNSRELEQPEKDPQILDLEIAPDVEPGQLIEVGLGAINPKYEFEAAFNKKLFVFEP
jgi:hypothetical protein